MVTIMHMLSLGGGGIEEVRWVRYVAHNRYYQKHMEIWRNGR